MSAANSILGSLGTTSWTLRRALVGLVSAAAVVSGLTAWRRWRRHRRSDFRVFILEYHDVGPDSREPEGTVSVERLRRHLRQLKRRYRFATVAEAARILRGTGELDRDYVVITFDDGFASNYELAWPVLREEGVPATMYVCTGFLDGEELWFDFVERALAALAREGQTLPREAREVLDHHFGPSSTPPVEELRILPPDALERLLAALRSMDLNLDPPARAMSWSQVRELQAAGIEVGAHTVHHSSLATLTKEQQQDEIGLSRERVREASAVEPLTFAFPHGSRRDFDQTTLELVRAAGFDAACATVRGSNRPGCDVHQLRRIGIGSDSNAVLEARLSGLFDEEVRNWFRRSR